MTINISKQEVFNEVEKRSSIEGYSIPERYDNIWADKSRGEILDSYWIEGYTAVVQLLKRYLSQETVTYNLLSYDNDEKLSIEAVMPDRYNSLLDGSIETAVKMMIACNVLHGWLEVVNPESAAKYQEESEGYSEDIRVKLLYRKSPEKSFSQGGEDETQFQKEENPYSQGGEDDVCIHQCYSGLKYPTEDTVVLSQNWDKHCNGDCIVFRCDL